MKGTTITLLLAVLALPVNLEPDEFFVGLPLGPGDLLYELIITTNSNEAGFVVESLSGEIRRGTASSNAPAIVTLPGEFMMITSGFMDRMKGIRVYATGDSTISVLVVVSYPSTSLVGYASFPVYPNTEFQDVSEYEYLALSTDYALNSGITDRNSNVLIICNSDGTTVSITPTQTVSLPQDAQSDSALVEVTAGTVHNVTLNRLQTLLIASLSDLTGTKLISNKPLTVLTGHQCAQFPATTGFCEPIYVHVPPTLNWGQNFLLAPFAGRNTTSEYYKIVTSVNSTQIAFRCNTQDNFFGRDIATAGTGEFIILPANLYCYLVATHPIFVVHFGLGFISDNLGDPAVCMVSPTTSHISSTVFVSLPTYFPERFVTVTLLVEHFSESQILLDGSQLTCSWSAIPSIDRNNGSTVGYGCTARVAAGAHVISHSGENGALSVTAYGWNSRPQLGYAYLTGINLQITQPSTNDSISFEENLPFINLDVLSDVRELPREVEAHSPSIAIPGGLVFGDQNFLSVFVNENGAFSFENPWEFSHPNSYPTRYTATRVRHVISPFWSDNDIRREGAVRYVTIDRHSPMGGSRIMDEVAAFVNAQLVSNGTFQPTWMIIAQWDRVHPYPHGGARDGVSEQYLNQTNTYQGVIITDTISTYYVFSYPCGDIQWSGQGQDTAIVGYNSRGDYFNNHPANGLEEIGQIVSCNQQVQSGRRKRNANQFTGNSVSGLIPGNQKLQSIKDMCTSFADADDSNIQDVTSIIANGVPTSIVDELPHCPAFRAQIDTNPEFQPYSQQGQNCFRSRQIFMPNFAENQGLMRLYEFVSVCCYNQIGAIIRNGIGEGRLTDLTISTSGTGKTIDAEFRRHCCASMIQDPSFCERYLRKRPSIPIVNANAAKCASGHGDPHYRTFDNRAYTFYQIGDYTMVQITFNGTQVFHLQGRLDSIPNGMPSRPSWVKALAFGVPGVFGYQFGHEDSPRLFKSVGAGAVQEVTGMNVDNEHVEITWITANRVAAVIKGTFVEIDIRWHGNRLDFTVCIPSQLCSLEVDGHLGNCDNNPSNDVSRDDEHRIDERLSLFAFGQVSGRKKRQASNPPFTGLRFEQLTFTGEQRNFCNNDSTCLYDLAITGDEEIGIFARNFSENSTRLQEVIRNSPPEISVDNNVFNITIKNENIYSFVVTDSTSFDVSVYAAIPAGGLLEDVGEGRYVFYWTPESFPTALSFVAVDAQGAATLHSPILQVCACFNGGRCTTDGVPITDQLTRNLTCICPEAYSGATCSEDRNGCSEIECFNEVECQDIPAPGAGAVCGPCPAGFTGDGVKCLDLDECAMNNSQCDQICNNTFGSYQCSCSSGYRLRVGSNRTCEDVNECSGEMSVCQQNCTNMQGSFLCSCMEGFVLSSDNRTCTPIQSCGSSSCSHICAIVKGRESCFCPIGFELATNSTTVCEDVNECDRFRPCDQICNNSVGSFSCECNDGYAYQTSTQACEDIDECREAALNSFGICTKDNTRCVNNLGGFECLCVDGYEYNITNGECIRITVEEEIQGPPSIPSLGQENTYQFVTFTLNISQLTPERIQAFRLASAQAITRYCKNEPCSIVSIDGEQSLSELVKPQNIAIPPIAANDNGRPVMSFYVQLGSSFVSLSAVNNAVEQATDLYQDAGFLPLDLCELSQCENGATCTSTDQEFTCTCPASYTGQTCSIMAYCANNPCKNGGECSNKADGFACKCLQGFSGDHCEKNTAYPIPIIIASTTGGGLLLSIVVVVAALLIV